MSRYSKIYSKFKCLYIHYSREHGAYGVTRVKGRNGLLQKYIAMTNGTRLYRTVAQI